jgi:hypothetical protein
VKRAFKLKLRKKQKKAQRREIAKAVSRERRLAQS